MLSDEAKNEQKQSNQQYKFSQCKLDERIWTIYHDMQQTIDGLDSKIQTVFEKHQNHFISSYKKHISKIKKDLNDLKLQEQQKIKQLQAEDRYFNLQKQLKDLREQALKLYKIIDKQKRQLQNAQKNLAQRQAQSRKLQSQNRDLLIQLKKLKVTQANKEQKITSQIAKQPSKRYRNLQIQQNLPKVISYRSQVQSKHSVEHNSSSKHQTIKLNKSLQISPQRMSPVTQNQLQQWFLECVRVVKKQIQLRKNTMQFFDFSKINDIKDFRLVDKLKVLELLLFNQKLFNWLYNTIFPSKLEKIRSYFNNIKSGDQLLLPQKQKNSKENNNEDEQLIHLPKVSQKKITSPLIRNTVVLKNGSLSLTPI